MEPPYQNGCCDSCGRTNVVLYKLSLGHDFFDRPYDRLSATGDMSPRWYCEECSREKDFQRDVRVIREEFSKLREGQASYLDDRAAFVRARARIAAIDQTVKKGRSPHVILVPREVAHLLMEIDSWADDRGIGNGAS
ncbi:MAG: hypothetical protein ACYDBP_08300 [Leptospirales bacterium]